MFGCKRFHTSGDMEVIILSPHCDLDLEDGNPTFHMTFQVMLMHHHAKFHEERLSGSEDIIPRNIPQGFEPLLWPWPWRHQSKIVNNTPAHDDAPLFHIWLQKVKKYRRYRRKSYFLRIWPHPVTLTLKIGTQPFCMTLRVMMMHHHTKFGYILLRGSDNILRTKV